MWKVAALLGLMVSPALAQNSETIAHCETYGGLASEIMKHRQNGVAMSAILAVLGDEETQEKAMVREAFEQPRFHSPSGKKRAIEDYRASIELRCFKSKE